jgi:hypothetical protein
VSTREQPISVGESYTQNRDWTDGRVQSDPNAPQDGFLFRNETNSASCILYKRINDRPTPIYFSEPGALPQGSQALVPKSSCKISFERMAEIGMLVGNSSGPALQVDFKGATTRTVKFDAQGNWSVVS